MRKKFNIFEFFGIFVVIGLLSFVAVLPFIVYGMGLMWGKTGEIIGWVFWEILVIFLSIYFELRNMR